MKNAIQDHIGSLNWNYRVELRSKEVTYQNSYGEFIDKHKIKVSGYVIFRWNFNCGTSVAYLSRMLKTVMYRR